MLVQTATETDKSRKDAKQDTLSGLLASCISRLGNYLNSQKALELLTTYIQMFTSNNTVTGDGLLVLDSLANVLTAQIKPELIKIIPILKYGLAKFEDTELNRISFTFLCTLVRNLKSDFNEHVPEMLNLSMNALKADNLEKNNKLSVIAAIGEFALWIPQAFSK